MTLKYKVVRLLPIGQLRKKAWALRLLENDYVSDLVAARRSHDQEKVHDIEGAYLYERREIEEEINGIISRKLLRRARELRVPVPPLGADAGKDDMPEYWEKGWVTGRWFLNEKGILAVREEIRREERWKMERLAQWKPWINTILSLLAAAAGFAAGRLHGP